MPFQRKSGIFTARSDGSSFSGGYNQAKVFAKSESAAIKRHQYNSAVLASGSVVTDLYAPIPVVQMKRTFTANPDEPDTPSSGSN